MKKNWSLIILLVTCLARPSFLTAQKPAILFDHLTTADGLSNNDVKKIYKDRKGFLWIGTEYGLNRYDGKNFKVFRHNEKDSTSILSNVVSDIAEDQWGYYWIATFAGICRFNPMTDEFIAVPFPPSKNKDPLVKNPPAGRITWNPFDSSLWVCSGEGLHKVNAKKNVLEPAPDNDSRRLLSQPVKSILITSPDQIWLGTHHGLLLYHPSTGLYEKIFNQAEQQMPFNLVITCLYADNNGLLWAGTWGAGLHCYDMSTRSWKNYFLPEPHSGLQGSANIILDITQTDIPGQENTLWIANETHSSLQTFDIKTCTFHSYRARQRDDRFGVFERARNLFYTKEEGLWIASTLGIYRYDPNRQLFREYAFDYPFKKDCLTLPLTVYADPKDKSGNTLLVAIWTCGLYNYSISDGVLHPLPGWLQAQLPGDLTALSFYRDRQQRLWIGSNYYGLIAVDEEKRKLTWYSRPGSDHPVIPATMIKAIKEDNNNALWIGSDSGVFVLDAARRNVHRITWNTPQAVSSTLSVYCNSICFDKQGNVWISCCEDAVKLPVIGKIAPGSFVAQPFYNISADTGSFPERVAISNLLCDDDDNVWCASRNGLIKWKAGDPHPAFERFTDADGLCASNVYKIIKDNNGRIWATTVNGLSMYDPRQKKFRNFSNILYGLDKENTSRLFFNPYRSEVLLGYYSKLFGLLTEKAAHTLSPPHIVITDFKIDNKTFLINQKQVSNGAFVDLAPGQNMITVDFAALAYTNSSLNRYACKLEGVDKDWIYTSNNSVSYKLRDGHYYLRIIAINADGIRSREEAVLEILIRPPYYKTWWFILLCLLGVSAALYLVFHIRLRRLKAIYLVRNVIARDLHDDIGSTLTSINILSQVSRNHLEKDRQKTAILLNRIAEQSEEMQQNMSDIVWAIRPDNDRIENMVVRMREYLGHTLEPINIAYSFETDEKVMKESLTMQQRRDFFLIFKEAITNMVKHSQGCQASIQLNRQNRHIELLITDNGTGFDVAGNTSSNGLKNMQHRAALLHGSLDIQSSPGSGTRIRLRVPATS